ncbi:hypothetical protein [Methylobacterium pseudosasicola]|uniref:Uncharacterized protein n=1 Tax=Methylobacterium pseudosasicola TaxID=582667 RepID=A0A1I4NLH9_9HYPH|nr:hypothetical protein [Methylobacterium pseudosasicola]SFM16147.1 hypothetical protein SAMN05192568_102145 [Methylobacterium pseudosasicola]
MSRRPLTDEDVRVVLSAAVRIAGGQRPWSRLNGISQSYVSKVLRGDQPPGERVLAALGLAEMPRTYTPIDGGRP